MASRTCPQECVEFQAPDVRIARVKKTKRGAVRKTEEGGLWWWYTLEPGFHYAGYCTNKDCKSHEKKAAADGRVLCRRGMGLFRPNEDAAYNQIQCTACQTVFTATEFYFYQCSARISFSIKGQKAEMFQLSQSAKGECLEFGEAGKKLTYTSLIIDCQEIGKYEEKNMPTIYGSDESFSTTYQKVLQKAKMVGLCAAGLGW